MRKKLNQRLQVAVTMAIGDLFHDDLDTEIAAEGVLDSMLEAGYKLELCQKMAVVPMPEVRINLQHEYDVDELPDPVPGDLCANLANYISFHFECAFAQAEVVAVLKHLADGQFYFFDK